MAEIDRKMGDPRLGAQLRTMRIEAGFTQDQLAEKLGLNRTQVSRIESGTRGTSMDIVKAWYTACGLVLGGVSIGTPDQAKALADAVADLPDDQVDAVIEVVRAWPRLHERERGRILGIIESH